MPAFRVFVLRSSQTESTRACWDDLGDHDMDDATPEAVSAAFGPGEFLILDADATIVDVSAGGA